MLKAVMQPFQHLYVHIPFCPKVCPYCSFYKEASDRNKTQRFLDSVLLELEQRQEARGVRPETIFFGGGTPSALSTSQLEYLLGGLRDRLDLSNLREWTLEMNPATVSLEKARVLSSLGVNRISMGVQSWDDGLLKTLGRVHNAAQAERSYEILREAGFENVNLDFIFAVPGQTRVQWRTTLQKTIALKPDHISAYCLTYEEDTAFYESFRKGKFTQDADWDADLFEYAMDALESEGYHQYEISNYAKPGRDCLHNLAYWLSADYLGLGPSAFSTAGARRWQNIADTQAYCDRILGGISAEGFQETVGEEMRLGERMAFSLRTNRGIPRDLVGSWQTKVEEYVSEGFLTVESEAYVLTRRGKFVADSLAEIFV